MTYNELFLQVFDRPAALERILRVIRHRGFSVSRMTVVPSGVSDRMDVRLSLQGPRPLPTVFQQLKKLSDVADISEKASPDAHDGK
jgi:acetolactate synthase II small subunit